MPGDIGVITINMKVQGTSNVSEGHELKQLALGKMELTSMKWPFCFQGEPSSAEGTRSMLPFTGFNEHLNRLTLHVVGLGSERARVTWGTQAKEFTTSQLEDGINLAAEFEKTPFDAAFANLMSAVGQKQAYETVLIKSLVTHMRGLSTEKPVIDALAKLKKRLATEHAKQDALVKKQLMPVKHTLLVEELR
jgi:hypothetical protein